jgi:WD repeat and SOF domain-containing protein 1
MSTRERQAIEYRQKLVDKWSSSGDVRAVKERRHVPASVHNTVTLKRDMIEAQKVKEDRRRKHTRAGKEKPKAERKSESKLCLTCLIDPDPERADEVVEAVIAEQK